MKKSGHGTFFKMFHRFAHSVAINFIATRKKRMENFGNGDQFCESDRNLATNSGKRVIHILSGRKNRAGEKFSNLACGSEFQPSVDFTVSGNDALER